MRIELIYDADCPAVDDARRNLREALLGANLPPQWVEWERSSPTTSQSMRAFGSPTILVNGRDVAGIEASGAASCRIYQPEPGRLAAVPPVEMIGSALNEAAAAGRATAHSGAAQARWLGVVAIPAALASLLPVVGCLLCWPAYTALLSSLGVGFLASARYQLPLTIALLAVALTALGVQAKRRGFAPLILAVAASALIMLGKFAIGSTVTTYAGVVLLLAASGLSLLLR